MNRYLVLYISLALTAIYSCNRTDSVSEQHELITIDPAQLTAINDNGEFSACIDTVRFLNLESTGDCMLGDIIKVAETDSLLFIFDKVGGGDEKRLTVFDHNGKFVRQISKKGQGPGEYSRLNAFTLKSDTLYLLDDYESRILRFDLNGLFIDKSEKFDLVNIEDFCVIDPGSRVLILTNLNYYNPIVYGAYNAFGDNECMPVLENRFDRSESFADFACKAPVLETDEGEILLTQPFSPTVLAFDPNTMQTREYLTIHCDSEIPVIGENEKYSEYRTKIDRMMQASRFPISAFQTGKWLIVRFFIGELVYNVETKQGCYKSNMLASVESGSFPFESLSVVGKGRDGSIITSMSADVILSMVEENSDSMKFMPPKGLLDSIDEESNPVLIRYTFKQ